MPALSLKYHLSMSSRRCRTLRFPLPRWNITNGATQRAARVRFMLSYSPYDNVTRKNYPAMFVTAGFHDNQASYVEPAKWVARLRASKTDPHDLILKTDMTAGHGGRSGRLARSSATRRSWLGLLPMPATDGCHDEPAGAATQMIRRRAGARLFVPLRCIAVAHCCCKSALPFGRRQVDCSYAYEQQLAPAEGGVRRLLLQLTKKRCNGEDASHLLI